VIVELQVLVLWFSPHLAQISLCSMHSWATWLYAWHLRQRTGSRRHFDTCTFLLHITSPFRIASFAASGSLKVMIRCPTVWLGLRRSGRFAHLSFEMELFGILFMSVISSLWAWSSGSRVRGTKNAITL